eukprot:7240718-Prymnesium_polylepis.1
MAAMFDDDYYAQGDDGWKPGADDGDGSEWAAGMGGGEGGAAGFEAVTARLQASKDKKVRQTAQQYMDEYYALGAPPAPHVPIAPLRAPAAVARPLPA